MLILILILLVAAALAAWLLLTWWNAPESVTFKTTLQSALRDVRDVLNLHRIANWIITNATALAVFLSGLVSMADPTLRGAILQASFHGIPIGALALLFVTWLATLRPIAPTVEPLAPR